MAPPQDDSAVQGGRPKPTAQGFMQQGTGRINMKWLKKWSYLAMLLGMGLIYLTCVDGWQVYAEPLREAKLRYDNWYKNAYPADGSAMEGEGTAPGSGSGNAASDGALEGPDAASAPGGDSGGDPTDRGRPPAAGMRPCLPLADRTGKTAPGVRRESLGAFRKEMYPGSLERDSSERLTGNRRRLPRGMGGNRRPPRPGKQST